MICNNFVTLLYNCYNQGFITPLKGGYDEPCYGTLKRILVTLFKRGFENANIE
jgi:hypothetical protein